MITRTSEAQLSKNHLKFTNPHRYRTSYSSNQLPNQILDFSGETIKIVQIDPQITEIFTKKDTRSRSEWVFDIYLTIEKK